MTTIVKIVVSLVLLTAIAQAAMAALNNFQFEDAVHEALLFAPAATDEQIADTVVSLASSHGISLDADRVSVKQLGHDLKVDITYDTAVPLVPGIYTRTWTFRPSTSIRLMPGVRGSPIR